jgi:hypothetical protein
MNNLSRKYLTPANGYNAGSPAARLAGLDQGAAQAKFPTTGRELTGMGIDAASNYQAQNMAAQQQIEAATGVYDQTLVLKDLPVVNPLANYPNEDLIGRVQTEFNVDPFSNDIRPPLLPHVKPQTDSKGHPIMLNTRRMYELESVNNTVKRLQEGYGYLGSSDVYCRGA